MHLSLWRALSLYSIPFSRSLACVDTHSLPLKWPAAAVLSRRWSTTRGSIPVVFSLVNCAADPRGGPQAAAPLAQPHRTSQIAPCSGRELQRTPLLRPRAPAPPSAATSSSRDALQL
ncbi:hypothetical protein CRG98_014367 [Punica granatum]|uniref:Secreted protein n=1 Tax=Punica granatum TaxID=22663 RepID=A0A2I0K9J6_PUNGR|nr:hypothetical protein CRG98_014367 [Punica granatum]